MGSGNYVRDNSGRIVLSEGRREVENLTFIVLTCIAAERISLNRKRYASTIDGKWLPLFIARLQPICVTVTIKLRGGVMSGSYAYFG